MKRILKIILFSLLIMLSFAGTACAEEAYGYEDLVSDSGAGSAFENIPEETKQYFYDIGLSPGELGGLKEMNAGGIFKKIFDMAADKVKAPLASAVSILAVVLLTALAGALSPETAGESIKGAYSYISTLAAAAAVLLPLMATVESVRKVIFSSGVFMMGFVPVFAGILIASGQISTSAGFSGLLLGAAEIVTQISSGIITPLTGMIFALSVSGELGSGMNMSGFCETLKKTANYVMTFLMTIFVGIMGIQTAIGSASDTLSAKTAKFFVGSFVPVVGGALGEAVGTVAASLSLVRSTVGIYGIIAIALMVIPVILELSLWRLMIYFARSGADLFGLKSLSSLLNSAAVALSFMFGILICVTMLFIISLAVVISAGGKTV